MTPATNTQHSCPYTEGGDDLALFETAPATAFEGLPSLPRDAHRRCDPPRQQLAQELHPRERLLEAGPEALSSSELLALVLGGEPVRALCAR